ncbi:hypothetical protein [Acetobacterium malicum]|uniref:hypothetical protein n=1 Tax=Acetobacterium malicum TaxID=52692 RepID=UPI0004263419|nr:hypothetical protein [Acetobacterium dehalogenans]
MPLNEKTPILPLVLMIFLIIVLAPTTAIAKNESPSAGLNTASSANDEQIDVSQLVDAEAFHAEYRGHIQNIGDIDAWTIGPKQFGTMGRSLRIEGFMIKLIGDVPADMHIKYTVHVQNKAWLYPVDDDSTWPTDGAFAGTRGESLRLEAVHIKLVDESGNLYPDYSVYYRGHVENEGDIDWVKNNGELGSTGKGQRLEALEIKIVKETPDPPVVPDTDLTAYLAAIAAYADKQDLYTAESWSAYQTVLSENVMSTKNSQTEVDQATTRITEAQKKLVLKPVIHHYSVDGFKKLLDKNTAQTAINSMSLSVFAYTAANVQIGDAISNNLTYEVLRESTSIAVTPIQGVLTLNAANLTIGNYRLVVKLNGSELLNNTFVVTDSTSSGGGGWTPPPPPLPVDPTPVNPTPAEPTPALKKEVETINSANVNTFIAFTAPETPSGNMTVSIPASGLFSVQNIQELLGAKNTQKLNRLKSLKSMGLNTSSADDSYQLTNVVFTCNYPDLVKNQKNQDGRFIAPDGIILLTELRENLQFTFYRTDVKVVNTTSGVEKAYPSVSMGNNVVEVKIEFLPVATNSVKKAEETKRPADLDTARGWVDLLPDGDDKKNLNTRINAVAKDNIKAATFEKLIIPKNTADAKLTAVTARIKSLIGSGGYTLTPSGTNYTITLMPSAAPEELTLTTTFLQTIDVPAISGITVPDIEGLPVTAITETAQYTGTVTWKDTANQTPVQYEDGKQYTATITLTPKTVADGSNLVGYTLTGVPENYFTVAATETPAINLANAGVITALFPTVIDPVEVAVKAAETGLIEKENTGIIFQKILAAQGLVSPLDTGLRKQGFQARLDLLNAEWSLACEIELIRFNRSTSGDNFGSLVGLYLPKATESIAALPDILQKTSYQDRLDVINTIIELIFQEYSCYSFLQMPILVLDDSHKLAAVNTAVGQVLAGDPSGCQYEIEKGEPWTASFGGTMTSDTFEVTIKKGNASTVYSLLIYEFISPDFSASLVDNNEPKSAEIPFTIEITGFQNEIGQLLTGTRKITYYCMNGSDIILNTTLSIDQTIAFNNGKATLPVTLPSSSGAFDLESWDKRLYVKVDGNNNGKFFDIPINLTINLKDIGSVTVPAIEGIPVTAITETNQYTGTVSWKDAADQTPERFEDGKQYTATITLTPKTISAGGKLVSYTLTGVPENYFTVAGTETPATNPANAGVITALFPPVTDPVEVAVKAAETSLINNEDIGITMQKIQTAQGLVTPLGDSLRKPGFQARLDLLNAELSLAGVIITIQGNRMSPGNNFDGLNGYYLPIATTSIATLPDSPTKTSYQDRLDVINTIIELINQEYSPRQAFYQFNIPVLDDPHKLAAVTTAVGQVLTDYPSNCQYAVASGDPWHAYLGGNGIFDTFDVRITKGTASTVYSICPRLFITPDFSASLETEDSKSADTLFNILITGFLDENGQPLTGTRTITYFCMNGPDSTINTTLSIDQTIAFSNGEATLPVTLPSSSETFTWGSWDKNLSVIVDGNSNLKYFVIPTERR